VLAKSGLVGAGLGISDVAQEADTRVLELSLIVEDADDRTLAEHGNAVAGENTEQKTTANKLNRRRSHRLNVGPAIDDDEKRECQCRRWMDPL